jgi:hypothetical protein
MEEAAAMGQTLFQNGALVRALPQPTAITTSANMVSIASESPWPTYSFQSNLLRLYGPRALDFLLNGFEFLPAPATSRYHIELLTDEDPADDSASAEAALLLEDIETNHDYVPIFFIK